MTKPIKTVREVLLERCSAAPLALDADYVDEAAAPLALDADYVDEAAAPLVLDGVEVEAGVPSFSGAQIDRNARTGYVSVTGVIEPFNNWLYDMFGIPYTSLMRLERQLAALRDSELVDQIVMVVHSPGGSVFGVAECAEMIRSVSETKPITAYVGYLCASAAYWLASQCNEIVASPSALVGSIGAYMMHVDYSEMLEKDGVRVTYIKRPDAKTEGNPTEPLSESAREQYQSIVDSSYEMFIADISLKRSLDFSENPDEYARVSVAARAEALKLIDRVETFGSFVSKFSETSNTVSTRRARLDITKRKAHRHG